MKLIGREDLIGDARYDTPDARLQCEAEVDAIVTGWTRQRTKHEAMAQFHRHVSGKERNSHLQKY